MKVIRNVSLASGQSFKKVDVLFDEVIRQVSTSRIENESITEEYDFTGKLIIPGAVDMHTHILNGSDKDAEKISKLTKSALAGGYTTLAEASYNTGKPVMESSDFDFYSNLVQEHSFCDMALWGHCDFSDYPYHLNKIYDVWSAGVVGFILLHPSPSEKINDISYEDIMDLFDTIYDSDISFAFQGFDTDGIDNNKQLQERFVEQRLVSIRKILRRLQDNPLHLIGIFDKMSVDILNSAFRRADLTYAFPIPELINAVSLFKEKGFAKDDPFSEFVKLLFDSMKNGKLYTISTETGEKLLSKDTILTEAFSGNSDLYLKWTVPWVFSELWKRGKTPIQSCIRMVSENPAKRLGLFPKKGCIQKGSDADILIIDPDTSTKSELLDYRGNPINIVCAVDSVFLRGELKTPLKKNLKPTGELVKRYSTTRRKSSSTCWN